MAHLNPRRWGRRATGVTGSGWAAARRRCQGLRAGRERGSVALLMAIIAVGAIAMAGLVVDGGSALAARERAADLATQAARAGADALYPASLYGPPTGLAPDSVQATAAAKRVLHLGGATGTVDISGGQVIVHATIVKNTVVLSAFGLPQVSGSASAAATSVYGERTRQEGGGR